MIPIKKHYPTFAAVAICCVGALVYFDKKNESFSPYIDLTMNVHWDTVTESFQPVDLEKVSNEANMGAYRLGFITDAGGCNPAWGSQPTFGIYSEWGKAAIEKMVANDVELTIAFGGPTGVDLSAQCSALDLFRAYQQTILAYHPTRLDFSLENNSANIQKMMTVLSKIKKKYPNLKISFSLSTLPEGLTDFSKKTIVNAKNAGLDFFVNLLTMDYGPSYTGNMGQYAIMAAENLYKFLKTLYPNKDINALWQMIEITPMIGINHVDSEKFTIKDADTIAHFAKHFGLGGISMRLANRDFPCAANMVTTYCSGDNLQTKPYEFENRFSQ